MYRVLCVFSLKLSRDELNGHSLTFSPQFYWYQFLEMLQDPLLAGKDRCLTRPIANEHSGIHGSSV